LAFNKSARPRSAPTWAIVVGLDVTGSNDDYPMFSPMREIGADRLKSVGQ
jgi:hypothetical protein